MHKKGGRNGDIMRWIGEGQQPRQTVDEEGHQVDAHETSSQQPEFPRGPFDMSLLVRYHGHVARHLWFGEVN